MGDTIAVNVSNDSTVLDEREFVVEGIANENSWSVRGRIIHAFRCLLESLNATTFHAMPFLLIKVIVVSPLIGVGAVLSPALWATRQDIMEGLQ